MRTIGLLLLFLSLPALAWGNAGVCGDTNGVRAFRPANVGPANVGPADCFLIPEEATEAQVALWDSTPNKRHLRVVDGLLALKAPQDLAAIVAADAATAAAQAELATEQATNPVCNVPSLQEALSRIQAHKDAIQADIDAIDTAAMQADVTAIDTTNSAANIGRIKTALSTMGTNVNRVKTAQTTANTRVTTVETNIVKCLFVLLRTR